MNEQIKELWNQAVERRGGGANGVAYFAELIVKECINVCKPVLDEPYEDIDEFDKGLVEGQDIAIERIKKHFGVEE